MNLRQIEVFQAVMETGSMSAAGRLIHLTQPAISRIISSAEVSLGYALFQRIGGRLVPTTEGLLLFEASTVLFENMQAFKRTSIQLKSGDLGKLVVAAIPAICHRLLPQVLTRFRQAHPDVVCEVHTLHKRQIADELVTGSVDIGLDLFGISHSGVETRVLGTGALYVLLPAAALAPAGARATPAWLKHYMAREPMIALVDSDPISMAFGRYCERLGLQPSCRTQVHTSQLAEALVAGGLGWTVVDFISAATCDTRLKSVALQPLINCTLNSFVVKGRAPSSLTRKFVEIVHEVIVELARKQGDTRAPA